VKVFDEYLYLHIYKIVTVVFILGHQNILLGFTYLPNLRQQLLFFKALFETLLFWSFSNITLYHCTAGKKNIQNNMMLQTI